MATSRPAVQKPQYTLLTALIATTIAGVVFATIRDWRTSLQIHLGLLTFVFGLTAIARLIVRYLIQCTLPAESSPVLPVTLSILPFTLFCTGIRELGTLNGLHDEIEDPGRKWMLIFVFSILHVSTALTLASIIAGLSHYLVVKRLRISFLAKGIMLGGIVGELLPQVFMFAYNFKLYDWRGLVVGYFTIPIGCFFGYRAIAIFEAAHTERYAPRADVRLDPGTIGARDTNRSN